MMDKTFLTSAFTKNLFARKQDSAVNADHTSASALSISVLCPIVMPEQTVAIAGNQACLGNWNVGMAPCLSDENFPVWETSIDLNEIVFPLEYKFIVKDADNNLCYWEDGFNRRIEAREAIHEMQPSDFRIPPVMKWKSAGTVVPVFSLRSNDSFGIGDIGDLKRLVDWTKHTGQHFIQVLPMNDTTRTHSWRDSYPYSAISTYALHPLYISIPMLGRLKKGAAYHEKVRSELNSKPEVEYREVEAAKTQYYREYFEQEHVNILNNNDFKNFIATNKAWLLPYAAFSYLRDTNNTANFRDWKGYSRYSREKIEQFCKPGNEAYKEMTYIFFIQYTLHSQFKEVADYARANGVVLKGDIPIGVNRESVEAWIEPELFNMNEQTGAPPDDFSETGQNWSFPTYNWEVMERDNFDWWKRRFRKLADYFDCIRIDHILGFFRIWEIPYDYIEGLCGHFRPALPLSKEDIEAYGLRFDKNMLIPRINKDCLKDLFGDIPQDYLSEYLVPAGDNHLTLRDICSTQRKIIRLFKEEEPAHKKFDIREKLMRLANEVLFLEDPYKPGYYHPRISAYKSLIYRELSESERHAFDRLYNDFFFERHNNFWSDTALKRLRPLIDDTEMLICGEDLGMIPSSVHEVMDKLNIFSLELERMPKTWGVEFTDLKSLPYHSVCTTSTHDMNPLRAWWTEDHARTQRYFNNILHREGNAPTECTPEISEQIVGNHLASSSMLVIIPLQDWFATDERIRRPDAQSERINVPSDPDNYWRYRMHISLEDLLQANDFNTRIRTLIVENGR